MRNKILPFLSAGLLLPWLLTASVTASAQKITAEDHSRYMRIALDSADKAGNPFGSVIVTQQGTFVAAGNSVRKDGPTAHAEMNAIRKLAALNYEKAHELTLYTTAEPCSMCMSAIIWAGIGRVYFGMPIDGISRYYNQIQIPAEEVASKAWYEIELSGPLMEKECTQLFDRFATK
jgi:tRNA(Arg) A34 adenosine deaminase TadA